MTSNDTSGTLILLLTFSLSFFIVLKKDICTMRFNLLFSEVSNLAFEFTEFSLRQM